MRKKLINLGILTLIALTSCGQPSPIIQSTESAPTAPVHTSTLEIILPTPTIQTVSPNIHVANGDIALFNGDYSLAQTEYQAALANGSDPSVLAAALWGLGRANGEAGNLGSALNNLNRLILEFPDSPHRYHAHFLRGEILFHLERYREAVEAYSIYLFEQPGVIDYYVYERRGDSYEAMNNYANAIGDYQTALNSSHIGDDTYLQIKIAKTYELAGDTVTALTMYAAISENSSNDYIRAQMDLYSGRLYMSLNRIEEAYDRFLHSVENYPLSYDSYSALVALVEDGIPVNELNRGLVDYFAGQYGYALDAFARYLDTTPEHDGTVFYYRALAFREIGQYQDAIDSFTFFINKYSGNRYWAAAWDEKAYTQWAYMGDYVAATSTLQEYVTATSDLSAIPQILLSKGRIYERAGMLIEAALTWESIADINETSEYVPQALFLAGICYFRTAQYNNALLDFQRITLLTSALEQLSQAIFWIGKTRQMLGDPQGAQAALQQAAAIDPTGYYSLRARDMLLHRQPFDSPPDYELTPDLQTEKSAADIWVRVTFNLPADTNLAGLDSLSSDVRLIRGTELWSLGLYEEARLELEDLRSSVISNPIDSYRLGNYLLDLGLYRPAIFALRQVLTLAGMEDQSETLAAPRYFNLVRYGVYYQDLVLASSRANDFHPLFLFSVIRQESLFEGFVSSGAGARGLMQIIPSTGQYLSENLGWPPDYEDTDLYRPLVSVRLGSSYLHNNLLYFGGDFYAALAAYNAGPGNAEIWKDLSGGDQDLFLEIVRFAETRDYIRRIFETYWMYSQIYASRP